LYRLLERHALFGPHHQDKATPELLQSPETPSAPGYSG
jgi:hypothetical protein